MSSQEIGNFGFDSDFRFSLIGIFFGIFVPEIFGFGGIGGGGGGGGAEPTFGTEKLRTKLGGRRGSVSSSTSASTSPTLSLRSKLLLAKVEAPPRSALQFSGNAVRSKMSKISEQFGLNRGSGLQHLTIRSRKVRFDSENPKLSGSFGLSLFWIPTQTCSVDSIQCYY